MSASAAGAAHAPAHGETVDIIHHLTDLHTLETPFGFVGEVLRRFFHLDVHLPFETIELSGHLQLFGIDLSITKPVIMIWAAGLILTLCLMLAFRGGRLLRSKFAHLLEVYVLFIRDEVVYPILGESDGRKLLPLFLTIFFFILSMNLLGMVPWGGTATGNVNVTAGLAIMAFLVIQGMGIARNGVVHHFKALVPHGLPVFVIPIMIPIEIVGMFAKPFALCIRLFANMVAGHAVILAFFGLIFMAKSYIMAPLPIAGVVGISLLEIFVAHLQAFIFTILTALFTGMSMKGGH
ncbi:MAG: F0F1 ATP synthase subunit A [Calditrichaeota bacterium]|nr:F0F1 ATP synthase subunit A [Calditrichota bacterium]